MAAAAPAPAPVVFLHGIFGSTLVDRDSGRVEYVTVGGSAGLSTPDVRLPMEWEGGGEGGDEPTQRRDRLVAGNVIEKVGPVSVYGKFLGWLRSTIGAGLVHPFAYDWRRDNRESADRLVAALEKIGKEHDSPPIVIGHSNGGIVAFLALNKRPELFHSVIFVGTPFGPGFGFMHDLHSFNQIGFNKSILSAHVLISHPSYSYFFGSGDQKRDQEFWPKPGPGRLPAVKNLMRGNGKRIS